MGRRAGAVAIAVVTALAVVGAVWTTRLPSGPSETEPSETEPSESEPRASEPSDPLGARELIASGECHCGCGNSLPGSAREPECFGCSVGLAEVSFILESLDRGVPPREILVALQQPVLVEVFGNYTDPELPRVWKRARDAADQESHHRVVLRAPAQRKPERRAMRFAECAREVRRFGPVQAALIDHPGPWDRETLFALAAREGLPADVAGACLIRTDVRAQLLKDREHAQARGIETLPAVAVDGEVVPDDPETLRGAIRRALMRSGI